MSALKMLQFLMHTKTLKVRVKDKHARQLTEWSRSVNVVWNYLNQLSHRAIRERGQFLSAFDMHPYTKGAGKELGLHSQTLQCIAGEYTSRGKQFKKSKLKWRKSHGVKRSLGWIPINTAASRFLRGQSKNFCPKFFFGPLGLNVCATLVKA